MRRRYVVSAAIGCLFTGTVAFAATNWLVDVGAGSSGRSQAAASLSNLSITATASQPVGNLLYPGSTGDVVAVISNPNGFPVTITDVKLPAMTPYAIGYGDSALTTPTGGGCDASTSLVRYSFSTSTSGTTHALTSALTVAGASGGSPGTLTVTFTNAATMDPASPGACAGQHFRMPSFTGVIASGGAATVTPSPTTSGWTS